MSYDDSDALAAIEYTANYDESVREDIQWAIEYHDRAFFAQVVNRVLNQLQLSVSNFGRFVNTAYERFRNRL